jgi:hypothetical protein
MGAPCLETRGWGEIPKYVASSRDHLARGEGGKRRGASTTDPRDGGIANFRKPREKSLVAPAPVKTSNTTK